MTLPRVILKPRRARPFYNRHPWVFSGAIGRVEGEPQAGCQADLFSQEGEFIGRGLYNPDSNIRLRLYSWEPEEQLDERFWSERIDQATELRRQLFPTWSDHTAFRLVYSEADGLSGLTVDRYGDWLIVQLTSLALASQQELLVQLLNDKLRPAGIWLRTEKGIAELEGLSLTDGPLAGAAPPRPLFIEEHGIRFGVDIVEGQKTGFYLDQRENRAAAAGYCRNRRVLDAFCYSGGFGISALKLGGAKQVLALDVSEAALALARENSALNDLRGSIEFKKADAFSALQELHDAGERFDAVVLDPPKMTRHRAGLKQALRAYHNLNEMAVHLLNPGGMLVTCNCSGLISTDDFILTLAGVATATGRRIRILESRGAAPDHPAGVQCLETSYLQCIICHVE